MAVTITLDEVIRKTLSKTGLPLHYYIKYYVFAIDGLKELQFSILPCEKTSELTLNSKNEATLPDDYVAEVGVYKSEGDKLIELPHNQLVSSFNSATTFPEVSATYQTGGPSLIYMDVFRTGLGRQFGEVYPAINGYRIIPELNIIRVDNNSELTNVYLKYVSLPQKVNSKTLIHPYIEPAIVAYINWQVSMYSRLNDQVVRRQEYYNQRRLAKSAFNKINISDIVSSFRKFHHQAIKV